MEKFALGTSVFALACGLAFAQADAPQSTQPAPQPAVTTPSSSASTTTAPSSAATTMVTVRSWKGTLMDASCASGGGASSPAAESGEAKETKSADSDSPDAKAAKPHKNHRNRVDPQAQSCAVSNSTTAFALKTKEGQVLKFDAVGNSRAAEVLKTKWGQNLSAGKPIHAKVSGTANADIVTVTSVD